MITICHSLIDPAGSNIVERILELSDFKETGEKFQGNKILRDNNFQIIKTNERQIFADSFGEITSDYYVVASTHTSKSGSPALTCHSIGNWMKATIGGKDFELVKTSGQMIKFALNNLKKNSEKEESLKNYDVAMEVTHHGPYLPKPTIFMELGGSEIQWNNKTAAKVIAQSILQLKDFKRDKKIKTSIGLGGGHYCTEFNKIAIRNPKRAISHMCPKHWLKYFNADMLSKALECEESNIHSAIIENKGMGQEKRRILDILKENGILVEKTKKAKEF